MRAGRYLAFSGRDYQVYLVLGAGGSCEPEVFQKVSGAWVPVTSQKQIQWALSQAVLGLMMERNKLQELIIQAGVGGRGPCDHSEGACGSCDGDPGDGGILPSE